eukprot:CAMPEP_0170519966 /NCGR_PEP_ID=MMETSP0209-20121228/5178_1 /TAXON_ID=665100 ORGANISM="Litonotus pictus, Strain P1" /NCGR_SAMPLE_ID=MMETSP0209 /ASSEMBLY_ACC=CAM_ASM_000301 /LENGTH=628 /DNA_ID=CAMNT_0010805975 /DNA_START=14 /DNA_END=1900 /DNA_ORIENTATION=+
MNPRDYSSDSSDEDILVRTGNVPRQWYKDFDHLGYGINSKRVAKPEEEDEIEKFLKKAKSKDWWRNISDEMNNKTVYLSDKDLEIIKRIRAGKYASNKITDDEDYFEKNLPYQMYPLSNHSLPKKAFLPSKNEKKMINRLSKMIEDGVIKIKSEKKKKDFFEDISDVWKFENTSSLYHPSQGFVMPKPEAPDNDESYNFNSQSEVSLRRLPKYEKLVEDQYERLLDIFQSARVVKKKQDLTEEDILPKVPSPEELKPFPTKDNIIHTNHANVINAICVEPQGDYIFTGDNAGFLFFSDIITSKVLLEVIIEDNIKSIQYNNMLSLVSVCCEGGVYFFRPKFLERRNQNPSLLTERILPEIKAKSTNSNRKNSTQGNEDEEMNGNKSSKELFYWKTYDTKKVKKSGLLFSLHRKQGELFNVSWHHKGDFFAVLSKNELGKSQVHVHSLSSLQNFSPTSKNKGDIRAIAFHSTKPHFYVCADSNVYIYDLKQQELVRKFVSNLYPINSICLHPLGGDFVAGSLGGKVAWFQSDLSEKPHLQMEQYHETKIKALAFHSKYNLLTSASKEGKVLLYYSKVYDDFLHDPLIVPLTSLKSFYGNPMNEVNSVTFHERYPWVMTAGNDKVISIWS